MNLQSADRAPEWWDQEFAVRHGASFFQTERWQRVFEAAYGAQPATSWLEERGEPRLGITAGVLRVGPVRILYSNVPYGGFVGEASLLPRYLDELLPHWKRAGIDVVRIAELVPRPELEARGFVAVELPRHVVELDPEDPAVHEKRYHRSIRKNLRRATKRGVEVREARDETEVRAAYELYVKAMERKGAPIKHDYGRYRETWRLLHPEGQGTVLVAEHEGKIIAANLVVRGGGTTHDLQLAFDPAQMELRASDAVVAGSIAWAFSHGDRYFDFMGSPEGDENLQWYKEKWGGVRTTTVTYSKHLTLLGRLVEQAMALTSHPIVARLAAGVLALGKPKTGSKGVEP